MNIQFTLLHELLNLVINCYYDVVVACWLLLVVATVASCHLGKISNTTVWVDYTWIVNFMDLCIAVHGVVSIFT